jgi:uncharacterized membrane protein
MDLSKVFFPLEWLRNRYVEGLRFLAPFIIIFLVGRMAYNLASDVMQPLFSEWFGQQIPGLGVALLILVPLIIGVIALRLLGVRALATIQTAFERIPIVGPVFGVARQLISAFGGAETGFRTVVEIEYPSPGLWMLGFLTDVLEHEDGERMGMVYVPTAPTPNSGWLAIVPIEKIRLTQLTVNDVLGTVFSAGVATPHLITRSELPKNIGEQLRTQI